jgi:hypothetical protein
MTDILFEGRLLSEFKMDTIMEIVYKDPNVETIIKKAVEELFPKARYHVYTSGYHATIVQVFGLVVSPANISTLKKLTSTILDNEEKSVKIVDFEQTLSYSDMTVEDVVWIISKLSLDNKTQLLLRTLNKTEFLSMYSTFDSTLLYLNKIKNYLESGDYTGVVKTALDKRNALFKANTQHGQLSWILDKNSIQDADNISTFFTSFLQLVKWVNNTLDENEIDGMSKENFMNHIKPIIKNYPLGKFKSVVKNTEMDEKTLDKLYQRFLHNPSEILKFKNNEKICDKILEKTLKNNSYSTLSQTIQDLASTHFDDASIIINYAYKFIPFQMLYKFFNLVRTSTIEKTSLQTWKNLFSNHSKRLYEVVETIIGFDVYELVNPNYLSEFFDYRKLTFMDVMGNDSYNSYIRLTDIFKFLDYCKSKNIPITNVAGYIKTLFKRTRELNIKNVDKMLSFFDLSNEEAKKEYIKGLKTILVTHPSIAFKYLIFNENLLYYSMRVLYNYFGLDIFIKDIVPLLLQYNHMSQEEIDEFIKELRNEKNANMKKISTLEPTYDDEEITYEK